MGLFDRSRTIDRLARREAVVHLQDGQTSIRGFLMQFYKDPDGVLLAKPVLLEMDDKDSSPLGGELLILTNQIKFIQVLGG